MYNIYLTNHDLIYNIHNIKNYRIKGLSYIGKNQSVISIKNISDKDITKIILHEFIHGKGLNHCLHKNCIMNDAKGKFKNLKNNNIFKNSCYHFVKNKTKLNI